MPAGLIICTSCRRLRRRSPCDSCRRTRRPDLNDQGERVRRQQAVDDHVQAHGLICPGWVEGGRPAHRVSSRRELSADHHDAVAAGGDPQGALVVRCITCNGAKGARVR